jgi:hypothetical protein
MEADVPLFTAVSGHVFWLEKSGTRGDHSAQLLHDSAEVSKRVHGFGEAKVCLSEPERPVRARRTVSISNRMCHELKPHSQPVAAIRKLGVKPFSLLSSHRFAGGGGKGLPPPFSVLSL